MTEDQAWVLIIIAAASAILGYFSIRENRRIARQKATLDFIASYNSDPRVDEAHKIIRKYKEKPVTAISPLKNQIESKERIDFLFLMNMFESMAIGLTHDIYDGEMIKDAFGADLRQIYVDAQKGNLIDAVRVETPDLSDLPGFLSEYENLIDRLKSPSANRAAAAIRSPIRAKPRAPNLGDR